MNKVEIEGIVAEVWTDKKNIKVRVMTGSGEGRNGEWKEWSVASFYGRAQEEVNGITKGQRVRIYGKVVAFEYQDKWYTNFQADRLVVASKDKDEEAPPPPEDGPGPGDDDSDLRF